MWIVKIVNKYKILFEKYFAFYRNIISINKNNNICKILINTG